MFSVTRASIEMDLFNKLLENNASPKSTEDLGKAIGADPRLLGKYSHDFTVTGSLD